jgi:preprotein translocase subunit SecE
MGTATAVPSNAQSIQLGGVRGEWVWFVWPDGSVTGYPTILVLGVIGVIAFIIAIIDELNSSSHCDCSSEEDEDAAARHEREAARLRAQSRQTEAHTELTARLIDKARVDAEYKEIKQITDHDRKIRNIYRSGR